MALSLMQLSEFLGHPLIVTMFYSQCASVCLLLTARLARGSAAFKVEHRISGDQWIIARASPNDVRRLAAARIPAPANTIANPRPVNMIPMFSMDE